MHRTLVALITLAIITVGQFAAGPAASAQSTPTAISADQICTSYQATPVAAPGDGAAPSQDLASLDFDVIFLDAMIPHHQVAIDMATVLLERTERPELRDLAASTIEIRTAELAVMVGWRSEWYPDVPALSERQLIDAMNMKLADSPGVGGVAGLEEMSAAHMAEDVQGLCASGDEIDITFIDTLIAQNSSSIILARESVERAIHRELKEVSDAMIATQQFEIDQTLAWREAWFPGTPIPDHHG